MILIELGLHFRRNCDGWPCVEWLTLTMHGHRYEVEAREFDLVAEAIRQARA